MLMKLYYILLQVFSAFGSDSILMVLTSNQSNYSKMGILAPIKEKISIPLENNK